MSKGFSKFFSILCEHIVIQKLGILPILGPRDFSSSKQPLSEGNRGGGEEKKIVASRQAKNQFVN